MKKKVVNMILCLFLMATLSGCANEVPKPSVREGRFHFSVTYEMNGETETVSGVYVCKFVKATASINGWWRKWEGYIEGGKVEEEFELFTNEDGTVLLDLCLDPMYFMSDPFCDNLEPKPEVWILYNEETEAAKGESWSNDIEVMEGYGVKVISYEYDAPIENVYE